MLMSYRTITKYHKPYRADTILINVDKLKKSRYDIRIELGEIRPLAESIKNVGLLNPIIVRPVENGLYEVVSGHRRLAACRLLGFKEVPCRVLEIGEKQAYELSLIENVQRRSLNPIEEAMAFYFYVSRKGWGGMTQLAKRIGKSKEYVSHRIMLLQLPQKVKEKIIKGKLDPSKATELIWLKDENKQVELAELIERRHLTHSQVRNIVRKRALKHAENMNPVLGRHTNTPRINDLLSQSILMLRRSLWILDEAIRTIDECNLDGELRSSMMKERIKIHEVIDQLLSHRRWVNKNV